METHSPRRLLPRIIACPRFPPHYTPTPPICYNTPNDLKPKTKPSNHKPNLITREISGKKKIPP